MDWKGRWSIGSGFVLVAGSSHGCLLLSVFAQPHVALVAKSNMVVWEPTTKTEHLVQSLALFSKAEEFDFLIPTPSKPTVSVVGQKGFSGLYDLLHPKTIMVEDVMSLGSMNQGRESSQSSELTESDIPPKDRFVGGLEFTIIPAGDVLALSAWMEKKKYKPNQEYKTWLRRYVDRRWYLTAVHVRSKYDLFKTEAVRLTFKTETPICPNYSVSPTWLNMVRQEMYLVAPTPLRPVVGGKTSWGGKEVSHAYLRSSSAESLAKNLKVPVNSIPAKSWVSWSVEAQSIKDYADDLYFVPLETQKQKPPRKAQSAP